jgi:hypothetical protein
MPITPTRFDKQDRALRIFAQARSQNRAGRSAADNNIIKGFAFAHGEEETLLNLISE